MRTSSFEGELLKFSKGEYLARNDELIELGTEFVAHVPACMSAGRSGRTASRSSMRSASWPTGIVRRTAADLGNNDPSAWEVDDQGQPRDPWQKTMYLPLIERATGRRFSFTTSSKGGFSAIGALAAGVWRRIRDNPNDLPVVSLAVGSYRHSNRAYGKIFVPAVRRDRLDRRFESSRRRRRTTPRTLLRRSRRPARTRMVPGRQAAGARPRPPTRCSSRVWPGERCSARRAAPFQSHRIMTDTAAAVEFIRRVFGPTTTAPVFISSLPNAEARGRQPGERHVLSRDTAVIERFVQKWNREDRGVFFCVSTLKPSSGAQNGRSPRCKANVSEIALLHADIDLKSVELGLDEIVSQLTALPFPPSIEVRSGNGVHAYWLLTKTVGCDEAPRVEQALRRLADLVGGDPAVAEVSRLMRLPGTHNSKNGAWKPVTIEAADYKRRYELDELEEMVTASLPRIRPKAERDVAA